MLRRECRDFAACPTVQRRYRQSCSLARQLSSSDFCLFTAAYPDAAVFPMPHAAAAAASQAGRRRRRRTAYPRGAVAAGHRLAAVRATSPVGRASVGSGRSAGRRSLHLYAQFKWHTQRRGARPARIGGAPESVHRPSGGGGTGDRSRNLPGPADDGRAAAGQTDGRREKFNHETFMRRRVLTIRRQIAKRRRSEIIRNLQLTGAGRGRAA